MAEFIEREAAIQAVKHAWSKGLEPSQYIEIIPVADVVPVVRCKDCRYETSNQHARELTGQYWCKYKLQPCNADDFCSYGERRADDD